MNLILFVVFLVTSPGFIFLYGKHELVHKYKFLQIFSLLYVILSGYLLFFVSGPTFLVLVAVIAVWIFVKKKIFQRWTIDKKNSSFKNFSVTAIKIIGVLFGIFVSLVVVATTLGLYTYNYKAPIKDTDPNVYVQACRKDSESCYKLEAHYIPEACAPVEYDTRGAYGGRCYRDAYIEKIYFDNGGYITFESCDLEWKDNWLCFPKAEGEDNWKIEILEGIQ